MKQTATYRLMGVSPLLQHNGQLADPLNAFSKLMKKVSGKSKKTEADHEELARLEWHGSLYLDQGRPCIPAIAIDATLVNGAKKMKKGMQAKAGLICDGNALLEYEGPAELDALWADERFRRRVKMKVGTSGVMRTQPHFFPWSASITLHFSDELLNLSDVDAFVITAGEVVGLLEGRPRFGRYTAERVA